MVVVPGATRVNAAPAPLLERDACLEKLEEAFASTTRGRGWLVLVAGEAGVGKTALLRRFCDEHRSSARILWGACDALYTPSPLGPLIEVAESSGGEVEALVQRRGEALRGRHRPHARAWQACAERARARRCSLGRRGDPRRVRLLGRKVEGVPALVLVSYRDELDRVHPLRVLRASSRPARR